MNNNMQEVKSISWQGLWKNNPALVQLLGLCPLLAVTGTTINGLGLGLATTLVLICANTMVSLIRHVVPSEIRIPSFVLIIAAFVTVIQLLMNAFSYELYLALGIFIPLIVTNCAILNRAESYASKNPVHFSIVDGFMVGLGFTLVLVLLGALRECLGYGTLLRGANLLFGEAASGWEIQVMSLDNPFLLAILPPGAFLLMGFIIAAKNLLDSNLAAKTNVEKPEKRARARVTAES